MPLTRQMAIDWDSFELGSGFAQSRSQAKPGHFDLAGDFTRSSSRQEKIDVGSGFTTNNFSPGEFDFGSALTRRRASNEPRSVISEHTDTRNDDDDFL